MTLVRTLLACMDEGFTGLRRDQIGVIKFILEFFDVTTPIIEFSDKRYDDYRGLYLPNTGRIVLPIDSTLETAAHEAIHHIAAEMNFGRFEGEMQAGKEHGPQFHYWRKKVMKVLHAYKKEHGDLPYPLQVHKIRTRERR